MPPRDGNAENVFNGLVSKMTYLGDTIDYRIALADDLELRAQTDAQHLFDAGGAVRVRLPAERLHLIVEAE